MNLLHVNDAPGRHAPSWYAATSGPLPDHPPLQGEARADVCVVGGGYTGLSAALALAEAGLDVRLLEAQRVGFGASGRNGGQVGGGYQANPDVLTARYGRSAADALWQLGAEAMARVRARIDAHAIDCDFHPGVAFADRTPRARAATHRYADQVARRYGYDRMERLDAERIARATGSAAFAGGLIDWGAGHLHPLRYALGLGHAATTAGAILHERSEVTRVVPGPQPVVETAAGRVTAAHVLLACNGYLGRLEPRTAARVMPINNFIVATEPLGTAGDAVLPDGIAASDSRFVVSYWRKSSDGRLLFGGGETYGYRFPRDIAAVVRPRLADIYPQLRAAEITHAWGGTLAVTRSRLPLFARPAPGVWTATGYSGHGIALATLAGEIMAEAIRGTTARFDVLAGLPAPAFPGGARLRHPLLVLAMSWLALRDRLGL